MPARVRVFLDTSALFAGLWSVEGGARMILKLGEAGAISLLVSSQVLNEIEGTLRRKAPDLLGMLTLLLDRSGVMIAPWAAGEVVQESQALTSHSGDARVLAAAWAAGVDYFITLDREHFLDNPGFALRTSPSLRPKPFGVTPQENPQAEGTDFDELSRVVEALRPKGLKGAVPFPIGTPGDFLAWYRGQLVAGT